MAYDKQELILQRTFHAPIDKVWEMWTTPEGFASWYGAPGTVPVKTVKMDLAVGGQWECTTVMPTGESYPAAGHFRVIEKPTRLEFSFEMEGTTDMEIMSIVLKEVDGLTEMTFTQRGNLPPEEYNVGLREGWGGFFNQLEKILS